MSIESHADWEGLKESARVARLTLDTLVRQVQPGVTTGELDDAAARLFAAHGARSAPPSPTGFRERSSSASTTKSFMAFPGLAKSPAATSSNSTSR